MFSCFRVTLHQPINTTHKNINKYTPFIIFKSQLGFGATLGPATRQFERPIGACYKNTRSAIDRRISSLWRLAQDVRRRASSRDGCISPAESDQKTMGASAFDAKGSREFERPTFAAAFGALQPSTRWPHCSLSQSYKICLQL